MNNISKWVIGIGNFFLLCLVVDMLFGIVYLPIVLLCFVIFGVVGFAIVVSAMAIFGEL